VCAAFSFSVVTYVPAGIWKMDEPVGVGVWRKKDKNGNWVSEKSEFDPDASKKRADHLDHFLKLPSFQQRYELEVKARDSVRDARKCAGSCAECYSFSLQLQQPLKRVTFLLTPRQTMRRLWQTGRGRRRIARSS
jgi:hypothetical protein